MEFCNPLNLDYKFQHYGPSAHREAADPTLVLFKGRYYLFASMSAGFYYSDDLETWQWHENRELEMYLYAPDVRQNGDWLYFCASDRGTPCNIWRTQDPMSDIFEKVSAPFDFWDPDLFFDDDGRAYLYWGSGNTEPIWGIELDAQTMMPIGEKKALVSADISSRGWERYNYPGRPASSRKGFGGLVVKFLNRKGQPYMEGAYMNKLGGKYYLQYAAPGTEYPVYGDGYYVGNSPLGPFRFMENTPFSLCPSGFITGAGHGSTIQDQHGNLWHTSTMRISKNADFERRIGLFPAGVDEDGYLFCNQRFADFPMVIPEGKFDPRTLQPHYMLLSYRKPVTASTQKPGHPAEYAVNEDIRSWWSAEGCQGEWLQLDLGSVQQVHSIQVNLADEQVPVQKKPKTECGGMWAQMRYVDSGKDLRTRYTVEGSRNGTDWFMLRDNTSAVTNLPHDYFLVDQKLRYVKITAVELPYNSTFAVSGLRVFGLGDGKPAGAVSKTSVQRKGPLTAELTWEKADGAMGYEVALGIAPDKLYQSWTLFDQEQLLITTLNKDVDYYFQINAFNESGITPGTVQKMPR